jgi:hypothetical protein
MIFQLFKKTIVQDFFQLYATNFTEYKELQIHVQEIAQCTGQQLHAEFAETMKDTLIDAVFEHNNKLLDTITGLPGFEEYVFNNLDPKSKSALWNSLLSMCKFSAMIQICGSHVEQVETIAMGMAKDLKGSSQTEIVQKTMAKLMSDQKLLKVVGEAFGDPANSTNVLKHLATILRKPKQPRQEVDNIMSTLAPMLPGLMPGLLPIV